MNNDEVRKKFEQRFKESLFPLIKFDRTLRGVYANDTLQSMWEGFYACAELDEAEIAQLKSDREKLIAALNFYAKGHVDHEADRSLIYGLGKESRYRISDKYGSVARATLSELGIV